MHLEAEDLNDTGKLCVATVADVLDERIRIHFDGWDDCYDYWVDINSPYIHPCGWHQGRQQLVVPPEYEQSAFNWNQYIKQQGCGMAADVENFATRDPINFRPSMKLEVVDPRNPELIRPATVVARKNHRIKLHLDCWTQDHCFWLEDDSPDLHPIGWCDASGHELEPPPGFNQRPARMECPIPGCRGIGHAKRYNLLVHSQRSACPYAVENWRQKVEKPPRLDGDEIVRSLKTDGLDEIQTLKRIEILNATQSRRTLHNKLQSARNDTSSTIEKFDKLVAIKQELQEALATESHNGSSQVNDVEFLSYAPSTSSSNSLSTNMDIKPIHLVASTTSYDSSCATLTPPSSSAKSSCTTNTNNSHLEHHLQIAKEFLSDYGPRLQQNYNIWQGHFQFDSNKIKHNPLNWSCEDTCIFVERILKCSKTAERFRQEDIDGCALLMLQQSDITDILDLKLGPAVKLFSYILQLRTLVASKFDLKVK